MKYAIKVLKKILIVSLFLSETLYATEWLIGDWKTVHRKTDKEIEFSFQQSASGRMYGHIYIPNQNCSGVLEQYSGEFNDAMQFTIVLHGSNCEVTGMVGSITVMKRKSRFKYSISLGGMHGDGLLTDIQITPEMSRLVKETQKSNGPLVTPELLVFDKGLPFAPSIEVVVLDRFSSNFNGIFLFQNKLDSCFIHFTSSQKDPSILTEQFRSVNCGFVPKAIFTGFKTADVLRMEWLPEDTSSVKPIKTVFGIRGKFSGLGQSLLKSAKITNDIKSAIKLLQTDLTNYSASLRNMVDSGITQEPELAMLVGNWSGEINFGKFVAPFQMTLWPTKYQSGPFIGGFLTIDEQCQLGVMFRNYKGPLSYSLTYNHSRVSRCKGDFFGLTGKKNKGAAELNVQGNMIFLEILKDSEGECEVQDEFCVFTAIAKRKAKSGLIDDILNHPNKLKLAPPKDWSIDILNTNNVPTSTMIALQNNEWKAYDREVESNRIKYEQQRKIELKRKIEQQKQIEERLKNSRVSFAQKENEISENNATIYKVGAFLLGIALVVDSISDSFESAPENIRGLSSCKDKATTRIDKCWTSVENCDIINCLRSYTCSSRKGRACEEYMGTSSSHSGDIYCDVTNPKNWDDNIDDVIDKICN